MKLTFSIARTGLLAAAALTAVTTTVPAAAQMRALSDPVVGHPDPESLFTSKDKVLNRNKQAALHIQRELLKCSEWARAGEWLTDKYIQHNPMAASGLKGVQNYFVNVAKRKPLDPCPALSASDPNAVVAVMAEGDYVTILTRREMPYADDPSKTYTTSWFDTWRFVDGKADEHWDPATLPAAPPPPPAPPAGGMASRDADKDAIEALMWRYDRALDRFETEKYVALYTEDGSFGQTKGREALRKMMSGFEGSPTGKPKLQHATSNDWVEFTGPDSATIHYYWQTYGLSATNKLDDPPKLLAAGNGVDQVARVNGQWLFKSRDVFAAND
ncbi:MAG: nuclear transport factor 2 family protein [Candidatus Andeanibacterium colombiense]|uniref:Nuclear transport factor 2 family protein n=1 Tax=Candidatus Andeanibacterium colombiense TaxID=3121345 RepID=A0AAJ6BP10_9SPHN|nr:MAG: nuclear transport factor 2 family protein [Sphingomonadaceae bacterium]